MTEEFGPPIAVNGKRPEWLGDDDKCLPFWHDEGWYKSSKGSDADCVACWHLVTQVRLRADHPYYQSAEYKASVVEAPWITVRQEKVGGWAHGFYRLDAGIPVFDPRPAMTEAEMIAALEATGHTVTPPDPLAAEREFLAGLFDALGSRWAEDCRSGYWSSELSAAMAYLRANKGRL